MYTMDQIHHIRELFYTQGKNLTEITREVDCDWRTAQKYVDMEDFSPAAPCIRKPAVSRLDPYKARIDAWLEADKSAPRKQRHTARRVHERLKEEVEGFNCSYRTVAKYVAKKKKELRLKKEEGFIPLVHRPGEAQADFGSADFFENGTLHEKGKYLVLSFPYSNGGYLQLNYGENMECLLEGLQAMFEHIGGVPTEIWFDNTSTIVTSLQSGGNRQLTERFQQFCEHYRFKPVFMNPNSGHEKGNVENKVGYLRRNELVPVPRFANLTDHNKLLLERCDGDMEREHYDKERPICELFEEDKAALLPLPSVPFDTALYTTARTNKYGKFTLNQGKHEYSASPAFCEDMVQLKITSAEVIVMDSNGREVTRHRRLYGDTPQKAMDWIPYLKYIARKPRSLRNSGIYDMMPDGIKRYMDRCSNTDRGRVLKVLSELTDRTGFESAVQTVEQALVYNAVDPDSLQSLYRRLYSDVPLLPPLENSGQIPTLQELPFHASDLTALDHILEGRGTFCG